MGGLKKKSELIGVDNGTDPELTKIYLNEQNLKELGDSVGHFDEYLKKLQAELAKKAPQVAAELEGSFKHCSSDCRKAARLIGKLEAYKVPDSVAPAKKAQPKA